MAHFPDIFLLQRYHGGVSGLAAIAWLCLASALGQAPPPPEPVMRAWVAEEKRSFIEGMARTSVDVNQAYIEALRALESRAIAQKAYAQAIAWRDQRLSLMEATERYDPALEQARREAAHDLSPEEAALSGSVILKDEMLQRWISTNSHASWSLRGFAPGRYTVILRYRCSEATQESTGTDGEKVLSRAGGKIRFGERSNLIGNRDRLLQHQVIPTKDWETAREVPLGSIEIKSTAPTLRLEVEEIETLGLMHLEGIRLENESSPSNADGPAPVFRSPKDLSAGLASLIERKSQPFHQHHLKRLQVLREQASLGDDPTIRQRIDEAMAEVQAKLSP
jgi:hypothetical protein